MMFPSIITLFLTRSSEWVKKSFLLGVLLIGITNTYAQVNYVHNPSFEQYSRCPYEYDQIKFADYWSALDTIDHPPSDSFGTPCAPEYCNECAGSNGQVGVPFNSDFYHYPRIGKGMAEVAMFFDQSFPIPYQINYLQGRLRQPLISGKSYCVTFYVALELYSGYAINNIGAYLDDGEIDTTQNCGLPQTTHVPQIVENTVIYDSIHWTKIEGSFIATGMEKYITIGNFSPYAQTTAIRLGGASESLSFYLIDDVSVVEGNIPAYTGGDRFKSKYDSVFVGRHEIIPDCEWYRNGVLIDTVHAGFWVKDTVTTTYVVKQSICGNVKYDTAVIRVENVGIGSISNEHSFKIFPNPAQKEITIQTVNDRSTATVVIYDLSGRMILSQDVQFADGKLQLPIDLAGGVYMVQLIDAEGGKNIQRLSVL